MRSHFTSQTAISASVGRHGQQRQSLAPNLPFDHITVQAIDKNTPFASHDIGMAALQQHLTSSLHVGASQMHLSEGISFDGCDLN